jgi:hypothetical protein
MKAVIALSGLAGLLLLGPPLLRPGPPTPGELRVDVPGRFVRIEREVARRTALESQSRCRFEAERSASVPVGDGQELHLVAGSGSLEVVGVPGLNEVRAVGRACASSEEYLDGIRLAARGGATAIEVEALYPALSGWGLGGNRYASLELRVEVPEGMVARIQDGSGDLLATGVGSLELQDGSGAARVEATTGDLRVQDGSGELTITGVRGSVWIQDGSGEILLRDVGGDVEVEDSSGEVEIAGVQGSVTLSDSSGELDVREVGKDVRVLRDGSGSIVVDGVGGNLVVEHDGSGGIRQGNVQGSVDVPRRTRRG